MSDVAASTRREAPALELYPQREDQSERWQDRVEAFLGGLLGQIFPGVRKIGFSKILAEIRRRSIVLETMSDEALDAEILRTRLQLRADGLKGPAVARSFALVREIARRTIGQRHYDVQLLGGLALLHGMVAEMETGEGKTLTASLAVGTAALAGTPVHVITVNDYLVQRDAELMLPIYSRLGLSVGCVVHGMKPGERRDAYACDVVYATNKEIGFDYLRDRIAVGDMTENLRLKIEGLYRTDARRRRRVMRGLHFAIVDEADSVLVDEARTPLIISRETDPGEEAVFAATAMRLIESLWEGEHYRVLVDKRRIEITDAGKEQLAEASRELGRSWRSPVHREEAATQALTALHLFARDEHYLVVDGKIQIVDEYTGRIMADRSWNEGLHQLIEFKENCAVTGRKRPLARISYQRLFRRYRRLAGMTGTASEVAGELWSVYRLPVLRIAPNRRSRRARLPDRIYQTQQEKWLAIASRAKALAEAGRPVLIGTRSVGTSERLSQHLSDARIEHVVLNARQDRDEAAIVAQAGLTGRVTVATNMAGRGVDIRVGEDVADRGGLYVILSERHDARRIDRQLAGRCARQGEPGSVEAMLSLEDPILEFGGRRATAWAKWLPSGLVRLLGARLLLRAQRRAERMHSRARRDLLRVDQRMGTLLAFSGDTE